MIYSTNNDKNSTINFVMICLQVFPPLYVKQGHIHQHDTLLRDEICNSATRLIMTEKCVRHYIPELLCKTPNCITDKLNYYGLQGFWLYMKKYLLTKYANECTTCTIRDCYVCKNWYHISVPLSWLAFPIVSICSWICYPFTGACKYKQLYIYNIYIL